GRVVLDVLDDTGAQDGPSRLPLGNLVRIRPAVGQRPIAVVLRPLQSAALGVLLTHLSRQREVALGFEPGNRRAIGPVALLEYGSFLGHVGIEVVRRDQLVLGPGDELDERTEGPTTR